MKGHISKTCYRSKECMSLHANEKVCNECIKIGKKLALVRSILTSPASKFAQLTKT